MNEIVNEGLWRGVSKLTESDRKLLTLHILYGYSITEIARMQGIARPTVSKKLTRIKCFLKKFLSPATK